MEQKIFNLNENVIWKPVNLTLEWNRFNKINFFISQCKFLDSLGKNNIKTFGGFLENRASFIGFLEKEKNTMIHLGIDINNILPKTPILAPCDVTVIHVFKDTTKINGWGGRLIMKMENSTEYLLYGHLSHDLPDIGNEFKKGERIAVLGDITENGGWWPHLHVQCITQKFLDEYKDRLEELDGYFFENKNFNEYVVDPTDIVFT